MPLLIVDMESVMNDNAGENRAGQKEPRRVSTPLGIGIALAPFVFAWFLLREGYSSLARAVGFGWLAFFVLGYVAGLAEAGDDGAVAETEVPVMIKPATAARAGWLPGEPDCTLTSETEGWDLVKANAILTAERYAILHNPAATFGDADGKPLYQIDGAHKGQHTLIISNEQVALAQLVPLFDFCTPAERLDPEGKLWKVVLAKLNGETF